MKKTYYFQHDFYARQDPKLQDVLIKHGVAGIGIYWCIIEQLFEQGGYLALKSIKNISYALHIKDSKVSSIIHDFELFENDGDKFWSNTVIKRLERITETSKNRRVAVNKRWESERAKVKQNEYNCNTNVIQEECNCNTNLIQNKIKENKIKENDSDESYKGNPTSPSIPTIESLKSKSSWMENVAMNYGLSSVQEVLQWIDRFDTEAIKCKMSTHVNTKDLASHFCDWLRIKLAAKAKDSSGIKQIRYDDINW